jgi:hypothetical protein
MADIRIKDLTTTASTTASDDFFAADGATNGTRKLSAYSPTFGGNATVGGTLTVSGTSSLLTVANSTGSAMLAVFASAYATGSATPYLVIGSFSDPATSGARIAVSTDYSLDNRAAIQLQTRTTAGTLQTALTLANTRNATFAADVAISGTTASTSTSSGALVVSGGVGVAKSINAGALNESHTFTGGDTGSGTSIITCKGGLGATVFQVQGEGTTIVAGKLTANAASNAFGISTAQTPASASATGTTGTICWDTSYIYVCTATNTWKRVAISTW